MSNDRSSWGKRKTAMTSVTKRGGPLLTGSSRPGRAQSLAVSNQKKLTGNRQKMSRQKMSRQKMSRQQLMTLVDGSKAGTRGGLSSGMKRWQQHAGRRGAGRLVVPGPAGSCCRRLCSQRR